MEYDVHFIVSGSILTTGITTNKAEENINASITAIDLEDVYKTAIHTECTKMDDVTEKALDNQDISANERIFDIGFQSHGYFRITADSEIKARQITQSILNDLDLENVYNTEIKHEVTDIIDTTE